jgi:hypothetical protein
MRHSDTLNEQLQTALSSRVIIEQAKGKLAERLGLDMNQAFNVLRNHARARNQRLSDPGPGLRRRLRNPHRPGREQDPQRPPGTAQVRHHQPRPGLEPRP